MIHKHLKLVLTFLWMPFSLAVFGYLISIFRYGIDSIFGNSIYDLNLSETINFIFLLLSVVTGVTYLVFEIRSAIGKPSYRILTHFRFGPIAIAAIFTILLITFDYAMIEYSKYKLSQYVFNSVNSVTKPDLTLHNDYRGWCGNGFWSRENSLYFDTASSGITDENEFVRARSLLASSKVNNWGNGGDRRFDKALYNACSDRSEVMRDVAESILSDSNSSCKMLIKSLLAK